MVDSKIEGSSSINSSITRPIFGLSDSRQSGTSSNKDQSFVSYGGNNKNYQ
jgi:hypothetical protein